MQVGGIIAFWVLISSSAVAADVWPTRPVTVVLPFPAGGAVDSVTRAVSEELSAKLGQRFIVENRAGANGSLGAAAVAKAAPDGYTLLMATSGPLILNKYLYRQLAYDPDSAFTPVVLVAETPLIIVGSKKMPANNLREMLAYSKANPGKVNAGTPGVGSQGHLTIGMLNKLSGASITHVPYRDYPQTIPALLSGDLHMAMIYVPYFVPQVLEGKLTGLAVAATGRAHSVPDVPTAAEQGFSQLTSPGWFALVAPTGTPREIVEKINTTANTYLASEAGSALLHKVSMTPRGGKPEDLLTYLQNQHRVWRPIIEESNITLQ